MDSSPHSNVFCTIFKSAMIVKCLNFGFLPSSTGLFSIQLFSVYHVYIHRVITVAVNIQRYMLNLILRYELVHL